MTSRLDSITTAVRPAMPARLMIAGPPGAGKTMTGLSIARTLAGDDMGQVLCIDTEHGAALAYADAFPGFAHLIWRAPYSPIELASSIRSIGAKYRVIMIDSLSHFWRGDGGTLDLAEGKFTGWKEARPAQDQLVEAINGAGCHMVVCVRSKIGYLVTEESGKQKIAKHGMSPIQDGSLEYEVNVAIDMDRDHSMEITKSRTPVLEVGRIFRAGEEAKLATLYGSWLAGGEPLATSTQVAALRETFAAVEDRETRTAVKREFVEHFGEPSSILAARIDEALAWATARVATTAPAADPVTGEMDDSPLPQAEEPAKDVLLGAATFETLEAMREVLGAMTANELTVELATAGLVTSGTPSARRERLENQWLDEGRLIPGEPS